MATDFGKTRVVTTYTTKFEKLWKRYEILLEFSIKSIILKKNFKSLPNDSETSTIFSQPPLISFKRDRNISNLLVRSSFQSNDQPGTFKCACSRCRTCPFIHNVERKMSESKRSIKITDHFTCTSAN